MGEKFPAQTMVKGLEFPARLYGCGQNFTPTPAFLLDGEGIIERPC